MEHRRSGMRYAAVGIVAWLVSSVIVTVAGGLTLGEWPSRADVIGGGVATLVQCGVLVGVFYLPGLWYFRRRMGRNLTIGEGALGAGLGLNLPAFLLVAWMTRTTDAFAPGEERWLLLFLLLVGTLFGFGYARFCQPRPESAAA